MGDDSIKKSISLNLGKYREKSGMSQKELAKRLGVVPSRISNWETGANCPTIDILFEVCEILNVSINDIYGIYPESNIKLGYDEQDLIKKYRLISNKDKDGKELVDNTLNYLYKKCIEEETEEKTDLPSMRLINYYYRLASAGTGQILFDTPPTERIEIPNLPKYKKADYAIGVNGNSMQPIYNDGDTLLIEMTDIIEIGEIGIFLVNNECFVKKLGKGELISLNKEFSNIPLNTTAHCMGRVIDKL